MKTKLVLLCAIAVISLSLVACSSAPARTSVEVSYDDFLKVKDTINRTVSKEIEVPAGGSITVTLWSNQTTGFKWSESATVSDQNVVQQTGHEFLPPEATGVVGAAGKEVWTFKALKKGTSYINMAYSQPWEGGEKEAFKFSLSVTVK